MTFADIQRVAIQYSPAFFIDTLMSYRTRHAVKFLSWLGCILTFIPVFVIFLAEEISAVGTVLSSMVPVLSPIFLFKDQYIGFFLFFGSVWLFFALIDGFYFSLLFSNESSVLREIPKPRSRGPITIDVADMVLVADEYDVVGSFCRSVTGNHVLQRVGIFEQAVHEFLASNRPTVQAKDLTFSDTEVITVEQYARAIHASDEAFRSFLRSHGVSDGTFQSATRWVRDSAIRIRKRRRWWSRDYLGRMPAFGTSFSYGRAYSLERYGSYLIDTPVYKTNAPLLSYFRGEAESLETILVRSQGANAVVVAEDAESSLLVTVALSRLIERGEALPPLEHKKLFLLDPERIIAVGGAKALIEASLQKVFHDAVRAGNLVIVVPNVGSFMRSLAKYGVDLFSIMDQFLRATALHVIVLTDADAYHRTFEQDASLMQHFERVLVSDKGDAALLSALQRIAEDVERRQDAFFTYPAIALAATSARQLFSDIAPLDKATDLLMEAAVRWRGGVVGLTEMQQLIEDKTGVPGAVPTGKERDKLLALEDLLRRRVVGQPDAVSAVASTMRRARSGIRSDQKPMGSFLFLGPTGVGKTETVKALAEAYFGSERAMVRFDMSEFSGGDALGRFIGTSAGDPGLLTEKLREKPFAVYLFDEFEKASPAIRDLFLQLLDEGFITDARGKRAYARSAFLIATSNAASEEIFRLTEAGEDISKHRNNIIETIISRNMFRPELLNRFDGVILFHPMNAELSEAVARQLLSKFAERIAEKGYTLVINDALVKYVAHQGTDPKFGARPLNRAIAEKIEQAIADRIVSGELKPGSRIEFVERDLA